MFIDRGSNGFTSIHQSLDIPKQDARDHCAQNMDGWLDRFASQYPGEMIECLWDDGAGDTAGQRNRIPEVDTQDTADTAATNQNTPTTQPARATGLSRSCSGDKVTLSWQRVTGADGYNVKLEGFPDFHSNGTRTTRVIVPGEQYYWQVQAKADSGPWGDLSTRMSFVCN